MAERFTSGAIYGSHRATSPWTVIAGTKRSFPCEVKRRVVVEDADLGRDASGETADPGAEESAQRWRIVNGASIDWDDLHRAQTAVRCKSVVFRS